MLRKTIFGVLLVFLLIGSASATTLEVGSDKPYQTVNSALSAATSGDTILVYPGTYNEQLFIHGIHDLTIQGVDYPTIAYKSTSWTYGTINLGTLYNSPTVPTNSTYNITIKGLHIVETGDTSPYYTYSCIQNWFNYVRDVHIEDNIMEAYKGHGIWLHGTGSNGSVDPYSFNDTFIKNNTITTTTGAGIYVSCNPKNLTIDNNRIYAANNRTYLQLPNGDYPTQTAYGINVMGDGKDMAENVHVHNNTIYTCQYSLLKVYAKNASVQDNIAYGNAVHNAYEYGFQSATFKNNSLINASWEWALNNPSRFNSINNLMNSGGPDNHHTLFEGFNNVNSSAGRMVYLGGHDHNVVFKNATMDKTRNPFEAIIIYGFSGSTLQNRTSDKIIIDNVTIVNHTAMPNYWGVSGQPATYHKWPQAGAPMWVMGAGSSSYFRSAVPSLSAITRDNITFFDVKDLNDTWGDSYNLGIFYADYTNVSLILANSNLTTRAVSTGGTGLIDSHEIYYFTDIDVTENGQPAGTSKIFVNSNTTRSYYNEAVPYFTANYADSSQENYTYQQTAKGMLDTPECIETLSNGQTGTRATPNNCLLLASVTGGDYVNRNVDPIINTNSAKNVYYNLTVSGGSYNESYFYTLPSGLTDVVTVDSNQIFTHKYGTKLGTVTGYHPTSSQYKTNSYERGTVDLTIPITDYAKTIIPMGVAM